MFLIYGKIITLIIQKGLEVKGTMQMAPVVQKAASATILSFLGSSFILGIAVFLMKDTVDRVNKTVDNVNKHNEKMVSLDGSINTLNLKIDKLDNSVSETVDVLSEISINVVRVTERLISVDDRCSDQREDIKNCRKNIQKVLSLP